MQNRDDGLRPLHATNPCARGEKIDLQRTWLSFFELGEKPVYIARLPHCQPRSLHR